MPQWSPSSPVKSLFLRFDIHLYPLRFFFPITVGSEPTNSDYHWISTFSSKFWDVKTRVTDISNQKQQSQALGIQKSPSILTDFHCASTKASEQSCPSLIPCAWVCGGPKALLVPLEMAHSSRNALLTPVRLSWLQRKCQGINLQIHFPVLNPFQSPTNLGVVCGIICSSHSSQCNSLLRQPRAAEEERVGAT